MFIYLSSISTFAYLILPSQIILLFSCSTTSHFIISCCENINTPTSKHVHSQPHPYDPSHAILVLNFPFCFVYLVLCGRPAGPPVRNAQLVELLVVCTFSFHMYIYTIFTCSQHSPYTQHPLLCKSLPVKMERG